MLKRVKGATAPNPPRVFCQGAEMFLCKAKGASTARGHHGTELPRCQRRGQGDRGPTSPPGSCPTATFTWAQWGAGTRHGPAQASRAGG